MRLPCDRDESFPAYVHQYLDAVSPAGNWTAAVEDYADLIAESPVAGFRAKSELSARRIDWILGHAPYAGNA
jgi:hypothetical protein